METHVGQFVCRKAKAGALAKLRNMRLQNGDKNVDEIPMELEVMEYPIVDDTLKHESQTTRAKTCNLVPRLRVTPLKHKNLKIQNEPNVVNPFSNRANGQQLTETKFIYSSHVTEDHSFPIFDIKFHQNLADKNIFATVGRNRVTIYECTNKGSNKNMVPLLAYEDPEPNETFYSCDWSENSAGRPVLAAGGKMGIIRIFEPPKEKCVREFGAHGCPLNHVQFHPKNPNLLLSASKDYSLRLWNIETGYLIVIFGGDEGHRAEVLGADIDRTGSRIVSCGMDHSLKVWSLTDAKIQDAIQLSYRYKRNSNKPFPTVLQNFPVFSTRDVHSNYVDCAKWFGELVFSKSCDNDVICWKAGNVSQSWAEIESKICEESSIIKRLDVSDCDVWFIRFSFDPMMKTLALGNEVGKIFIFDVSVADPLSLMQGTVLSHPSCDSTIRQTAFSRDGSTLICVCDDATIWRWDINEKRNDKKEE